MKDGVRVMNWWRTAGGLMASICAAGYVIAGWKMFYRPIRQSQTNFKSVP
jgi:hypothetical protein